MQIARTQQVICKDLTIKKLGEYHDLYVQRDTLLLVDAFENFCNMSLEIYELDPARFFTASGLPWQVALKRTKVKLDLLSDIDMLLMVEKSITGGILHVIHPYVKANDKYKKNYNKNKGFSYLKYWGVNHLYGCAMTQKLPSYCFKWVEKTCQFNEDFMKSYNYQLKMIFNISKIA